MKNKLILLLFLNVIMIAGCSTPDDNQMNQTTELEGTWRGPSSSEPSSEYKLEVAGDNGIFFKNDVELYTVQFTLADPGRFDATIIQASDSDLLGLVVRAIYDLDGNALTFAVNEPGNTMYPVSFDPAPAVIIVKLVKQVVVHTFAHFEINIDEQDWIRIVNEFEALNKDIDIQYRLKHHEDYYRFLDLHFTSGDIPDLAWMWWNSYIGIRWQEAGELYDHRSLLDPGLFDPDLIPPMGPNGEVWEIPISTSKMTSLLYMNSSLAESLGLSAPDSYNDLKAMVVKTVDAGKEVMTLDGLDGWAWDTCLLSCIIARLSGDAHWISKAVKGEYKFTDQEFVDSLALVRQIVVDGVISTKSFTRNYDENIAAFCNGDALFMLQGQWSWTAIDPAISDTALMLPLPRLPGERISTAGSIPAAIFGGYGLTKTGASNVKVRDAAMKFLTYFHREPETTKRLKSDLIEAPILANYVVPDDLHPLAKQGVKIARSTMFTEISDQFLLGTPNDVLMEGIREIAAGTKEPAELAEELEALVRPK